MLSDNSISHLASTQDIAEDTAQAAKIRSSSSLRVAYPVVFIVFMLLGIWTGKISGTFRPARGPLATWQANSPLSTPSNGQTNLLVIGVDRLRSRQPRLESIWLVGYFPDSPHLTLIPVFPPPPNGDPAYLQSLGESFRVSENGVPGQETLRTLQEDHIWWNSYVIIDNIAMIEVIDFLGGIQVNDRRIKGALAISSFPLPEEDASASLDGQTDLLQRICRQTNLLPPSADLRKILSLIPDHIQTDADIFQAMREWRTLNNGRGNLVCEFPLQKASLP
jgi:hypothetical protein